MNKVSENTRKIIGCRINELLAINDVKQKELAAHLSVSDNIVSYFVKGARVPNTEQIIKIAKFFNVPTDYLLGLTDAKTTKDTDLRAIVDYTGLSEECIKEISPGISEKPYANECVYILNQLFSTKEGQTITHRMFDMLSHKGGEEE